MERLVVRGVRKSFGATHALAGVELTVRAGEVHAVLGENGAGKSTLMGILGGALRPDAGTITLDGAPYSPATPRAALHSGVAIVHQELSLCLHLSVEENILLGDEPTRLGFVDRRRAQRRVEEALRRVGAQRIHGDDRVGDLSPAARQLVEIARALSYEGTRLLILDEPTSSLGHEDAERLFALVRDLRDRGLSVLYVSHFLEEVMRLCDRYTVLRDGASVTCGAIAETDVDALVSAMAGRTVHLGERLAPHAPRERGDVLLEVRGLSASPRPALSLVDATLTLHRGEVLGIAGLVGAGRSELLRAIFGLERVKSGEIRLGSFVGPRPPHASLAHSIGLLSEDRKGEGLMLARSVEENLTLSRLPAIVREGPQQAIAARFIAELGIRAPDGTVPIASLSGGNQQKVAVARLLHHDVDVLLLDEPTRGIDVRSKAQIYELIDALARRGKGILVVSSFVPELLGLCDRIAVMRRGRLGDARPVTEWTEHAILKEASVA